MKILHVEDNEADADLTRRALLRSNTPFTVEHVATLAAARARLAAPAGFDLVLADLGLPDGNGLELLAEIRERKLPVAVVILTRQGDEGTAVAALKAGADDYLPKNAEYATHLALTLSAALARFREDTVRRGVPLRVLYAEHHAADVDLTRRHLERWAPHLRLEVVTSSLEVIMRLPLRSGEVVPCDVVLLDYRLPDETALDVLKEIRIGRGLDLPVVLVTGQGDEDVAAQALRLGASDYLVKFPGYLQALPFVLENAHHRGCLAREHATLNAVLKTEPECVKRVGRDGRLLEMNPAGLAMLEAGSLEEAQRQPLADYIVPSHRAMFGGLLKSVLSGLSGSLEFEVIGLKGGRRWLETRAVPMRNAAGEVQSLLGVTRDITLRKQTQDALASERALLRTLFDLLPDLIYVKDRDSRFLACNNRCSQVMGAAGPQAVTGKCDADFFPPTQAEKFRADDLAVLAGRPLVDQEEEIIRPDGSRMYILTTKLPLKNERGKVVGLVGSGRDITDRKQMEEQFLRTQRVEVIGTLASGVAHDLNNILAPMLMAAGLLKETVSGTRDRNMLTMIERSAQRGAGLIRQLLTFSRGAEGARVCVQPRHLVKELVTLMQETFPRNVEIRHSTPVDLWNVPADVTQLHQVLMNLCVNARDAMPAGGILTVEAANRLIEEREVSAFPQAKPGPYLQLTVSDTGEGIAPEIIQRIFDPFFTTKGVGRGTGLGLATVLAIVKGHGGFVSVESKNGQGTVFTVHLPATGEADAGDADTGTGEAPFGHGELVMIVDDEEMIREAAQEILQQHGYRVLTCGDGQEAIRAFVARGGSVRLVLTDVMMPGMDGLELIRALRVLEPDIRAVVCSGQSQDDRRGEFAALGRVQLLAKPFTNIQLLKALETALTAKAEPGAS